MTGQSIIHTALHADTNVSLVRKWMIGFSAWRQRRRDRAELRGLSASTLRDLAIDRSEVSSVVNAGVGERRRNRS